MMAIGHANAAVVQGSGGSWEGGAGGAGEGKTGSGAEGGRGRAAVVMLMGRGFVVARIVRA